MHALENQAQANAFTGHPSLCMPESTKWIVFQQGRREFGIDTRQVQRVCKYHALTRVAAGAEFVKGVAVLDGVTLPIVDMRSHLPDAASSASMAGVAIILNLKPRNCMLLSPVQDHTIGLVVDSASDVIFLKTDAISPIPALAAIPQIDYLSGIASHRGRKIILLDMQRFIATAAAQQRKKARLLQEAAHAARNAT